MVERIRAGVQARRAGAIHAGADSARSNRGVLHAALIVAVALAIRLPLAPFDFDISADLGIFRQWIETADVLGLVGLYRSDAHVNYPPLSLYLLVGSGRLRHIIPHSLWPDEQQALTALIKLPSIVADAATVLLIWYYAARRLRAQRRAAILALSYAVNPAIWYVSAQWGQMDALYTFFLAAGVVALEGGAVVPAGVAYAASLASKLQCVAVAPLLLVVAAYRRRARGAVLLVAAVAGTLALLAAPWWLSSRLGDLRAIQPTTPPRIVVSAYNLWYLLRLGRVHIVPSTEEVAGLPLTYQTLGTLLFGAYALLVAWLSRRRRLLALPAAASCLGMFVLLTQMHERYMFPVLALLALATAARPRLWPLYALLSATFLFNLVTVAPFSRALAFNLVAAEVTTMPILILKIAALIVAALNVLTLGALTVAVARENRALA